MSSKGDIHAGHRARMRERFRTTGLAGFSDHEAIELLLYGCIPRIDVNELAHRIMERFGTFRAVFDASFDDLMSVEGVGENTASYIKLIAETFRRYELDAYEPEFVFDTVKKIGEYAVRLYVGVSTEKLYILIFDNKMKLHDTVLLAEGSVNALHIHIRSVVEKAYKKNAAAMAIIHNHPNGTPYPSEEDKIFSAYIKRELDGFGIRLVDHIIVAGRFYRPIFGDSSELDSADSLSVDDNVPQSPFAGKVASSPVYRNKHVK